jgi:hypothetical protein
MQNLKIRVNSPEESERAQRAFFALGYKWIDFGQKLFALLEEYLFAVSDGVLDYTSNAVRFSENMAREVTLLELEQLAAEAQNTGLNSFETMVEEPITKQDGYDPDYIKDKIEAAKNSGWNKDGRDADEQLAELRGYTKPADRHNETNPIIFVYQKDGATKSLSFKEAKEDAANLKSDGWAHVATLDAKVFVENAYRQESEAQARFDAALGYLSTESERWYDSQDNAFYPEDTSLIKAALKIAAGLDTTE